MIRNLFWLKLSGLTIAVNLSNNCKLLFKKRCFYFCVNKNQLSEKSLYPVIFNDDKFCIAAENSFQAVLFLNNFDFILHNIQHIDTCICMFLHTNTRIHIYLIYPQ